MPEDKKPTEPTRERRRKKVSLPPKKFNQTDLDSVTVVPTLDQLLNDALSIIGSQLTGFRTKTARGVTLDPKEARIVTNYLDALTRASKESREQARAEDLKDLTDEELVQLAAQLAKTKRVTESSD